MLFPHDLASLQRICPTISRCIVAYSGGIDSTVLLHSIVQLLHDTSIQVEAVHIHHGLQAAADDFAKHCRDVCQQLKIPCYIVRVTVMRDLASVEAAARQARYEALATFMSPDTVMVTAHHQNDQAETLLLQLCRGAGPQGLAAMPVYKAFATGWHWRPLLTFTRAELSAYAFSEKLTFIDDVTNHDQRFARNFVRQQILPKIMEYYPGAVAAIARSAEHCAAAQEVLDEVAAQDYSVALEKNGTLRIAALLPLSRARCHNVLRYWITTREMPLPNQQKLLTIVQQVLSSRHDAMPIVRWADVVMRRFAGALYLEFAESPPLPDISWEWRDLRRPLQLSDKIELQALPFTDVKIFPVLTVRFRRGGERILLTGHQHHKTLKNLWQEWRVPPWQRDHIPLIFLGETLIAVVGYGYAKSDVTDGFSFRVSNSRARAKSASVSTDNDSRTTTGTI